ncbi:unnamed protein product [Lepidochelys olivacea]
MSFHELQLTSSDAYPHSSTSLSGRQLWHTQYCVVITEDEIMLNSIQPTVRECAHSYWPSGLAAYVCCCARPASCTRERGLSGGGLHCCSAGREQSLSFIEFKACKGCPFLRTHEDFSIKKY